LVAIPQNQTAKNTTSATATFSVTKSATAAPVGALAKPQPIPIKPQALILKPTVEEVSSINLDVKPVEVSNQVVKMTMNYLSQTKASAN
jgi:hypothetical protein